MFKIDNDLQNAIDNHDIVEGKNAILCYLDSDPRNCTGDTEKAVQYALTQGLNVFVEHNPAIKIEQDRAKWNDDYIAYTSVALFRNFSKERFEHWKEVADYVRKKWTHLQRPPCNRNNLIPILLLQHLRKEKTWTAPTA